MGGKDMKREDLDKLYEFLNRQIGQSEQLMLGCASAGDYATAHEEQGAIGAYRFIIDCIDDPTGMGYTVFEEEEEPAAVSEISYEHGAWQCGECGCHIGYDSSIKPTDYWRYCPYCGRRIV